MCDALQKCDAYQKCDTPPDPGPPVIEIWPPVGSLAPGQAFAAWGEGIPVYRRSTY